MIIFVSKKKSFTIRKNRKGTRTISVFFRLFAETAFSTFYHCINLIIVIYAYICYDIKLIYKSSIA